MITKSLWILFAALIFKFIFSSLIPLIGDEAYYWVWSQRMQLSFFDHPPFVAWLFWISQWGSSFLGPRWASILMSVASLALWIPISSESVPKKWRLGFLLILAISPMIGFGSLLVTPDVPLFFFWSLSTWLLLRIIDQQRPLDYALLGLSLGLGFCSKYQIVLWPLGVVIFLIMGHAWNLVRWKKLGLTFLFGLIGCAPVLIWNAQHEWASFLFQIDHGLAQGSWDWHWTGDYLLGQFFLLIPFTLTRSFYRMKPQNKSDLLHLCLGWTPLVFFLISSFRGPVEANWPLMSLAHLGLVFWSHFSSRRRLINYAALWGTLTALVLFCVLRPEYNYLHPKLNEPTLYAGQVSSLANYRPLYTSTYQMASSIWYFTGIPTFKLRGESRYDYFDEMPESVPPTNHFYYLKEDYQIFPPSILAAGFNVREVSRPFKNHILFEVTR